MELSEPIDESSENSASDSETNNLSIAYLWLIIFILILVQL